MVETTEKGETIIGENIAKLIRQRMTVDPTFTIERFAQDLNINKATYYNIIQGKTKKIDYFLLQNMSRLLNISFEELTNYYPPVDAVPEQRVIHESLKRETKIIIPKVEFGYDGDIRNLNKYLIDYIELEIGKSRGASFCMKITEVNPLLEEKYHISHRDLVFIRIQDSSRPGKLVYLIENNQAKFEEYKEHQKIIGQVVLAHRYY